MTAICNSWCWETRLDCLLVSIQEVVGLIYPAWFYCDCI